MIRIRPFLESDAVKILSWCDSEDIYYKWTAGVLGQYPAGLEQLARLGNVIRFTAVDDNEPVGFFTLRNPGDTLDELRFGFVIVSPEKRGQGVGKKMLELGIRYAFQIYGVKRLTLGVFDNNFPAYFCYFAAGFRKIFPIESESYLLQGKVWKCIYMEIRGPLEEWEARKAAWERLVKPETVTRLRIHMVLSHQGKGTRRMIGHSFRLYEYTGWVKSEPDDSLAIEIQGIESKIEYALRRIRSFTRSRFISMQSESIPVIEEKAFTVEEET